MQGTQMKIPTIIQPLQNVDFVSVTKKEEKLVLSQGTIQPGTMYPDITDALELAVRMYVDTPIPPGHNGHPESRRRIIRWLSELPIRKYNNQILQVVLEHLKIARYALRTEILQPYIQEALVRSKVLNDERGLLNLLLMIPIETNSPFFMWTLECLLEGPHRVYLDDMVSIVMEKYIHFTVSQGSWENTIHRVNMNPSWRTVFQLLLQILDKNRRNRQEVEQQSSFDQSHHQRQEVDILEIFITELRKMEGPPERFDEYCSLQLNLLVAQILNFHHLYIKPQTMTTIMDWCTKGQAFRFLAPQVVRWLLGHGGQVPPDAAYDALEKDDVPRLWHILSMVSPEHRQYMFLDAIQKWYPQLRHAQRQYSGDDILMDVDGENGAAMDNDLLLDDSLYRRNHPYEEPFDHNGLANQALAESMRHIDYPDMPQSILAIFLHKCIIGNSPQEILDSYLSYIGDVVVRLVNVLHVDVGSSEMGLFEQVLQGYVALVKGFRGKEGITKDSKNTMKNNLLSLRKASDCLRARQPASS